ncbi:hypothetical protein [Thiohalorhabdus sp.]|uniref:hypothetical protein n=1 Tax=Thiohalorhabdus sp. TaxID=3094134 RepID=UPI002FC2E08F
MSGKDHLDMDQAQRDPGSVFDSPESLGARSDLTAETKRELLRRWAYDARELAAAEDEGMNGGEPSLLGRIEAVLAAMDEPPERDD